MDWWIWVLIGAAVVVAGYFKLKLAKKILENKNKQSNVEEDE